MIAPRIFVGITSVVAVVALTPGLALAGASGSGPDHGSNVVQGAALEPSIDVELFADHGPAHAVVSGESRCWYPQAWADDVAANSTESAYYSIVGDVADNPAWFSLDVPDVGGYSCLQHVFSGFDTCTDDSMIGVRSIDAIWDARHGTIGSYGSIGIHEYSERYCVEIIDIDGWRQIINASDYLPTPVRATYPQFRTLVGLENLVWYEVTEGENRYIDGFRVELPTPGITYNVNVDIWLEGLAIDINGDGVWDHTVTCSNGSADSLTECGGDLDDPLFRFAYDERAFHQFTIESRWAGTAVDDHGIVHVLDPNYLAVQYTFDWETVEVRSSLDN